MHAIKKTILLLYILIDIAGTYAQKSYETGTVTDIDSNVYKTVVIGKYIWMAENLRTTTYNNGIEIPFVAGDSTWVTLSSDAYCWYDDNKENCNHYGALYNWYTINTGSLCPDGWRVPSDEEWKYLEGYADSLYKAGNPVWDKTGLRGYNAGNRLKSATGWRPGGNGTDEFGFYAIPAGERLNGFNNMGGINGYWWTSTEWDSLNAWYRSIVYSFAEVSRDMHPKKMGFSVRCLKDT